MPLRLAVLALCAQLGGCVTVTDEVEPLASDQAKNHRNLGIDHVIKGRFAYGIRELRHSLELAPDDPMTHLWLGEAYRFRGRPADALAHTQRAMELDDSNHEARLNLVVLLIRAERYEEAIGHATILADDPTFSTPWRALTNRGWAELKLGRLSDARRSFLTALDFHPRYWPAQLNLGILAQAEGQYGESLRHLAKVLEREPNDSAQAEANYRMAEAYISLGLRDRALQHLAVAIERSPEGHWGKQSREYLRRLQ